MASSNITFTNIGNVLDEINTSFNEELIDSDIESSDISSVEMTESESESESESDIEMESDSDSDIEIDSDDDNAIKEIRYYQSTTHNLIPYSNFKAIVTEMINNCDINLSVHRDTILAIQAASEDFIINLFQKSQVNANHAGRIIITSKDIQLALN